MPQTPRPGSRRRAIAVLLCAALALVFVANRSSGGFRLAVDGKGVSFSLGLAAVKVAFDIGQSSPESNMLANQIQ